MDLVYRIEEFVSLKGRASISEIKRELGENSKAVSSAISNLLVKNQWKLERVNGRNYVISESCCDKSKYRVTIIQEDIEISVCPKFIPSNRDWVVTSLKNDSVFYFEGVYTRKQVISCFVKAQKVPYKSVRAHRYKSLKSVKQAMYSNWE